MFLYADEPPASAPGEHLVWVPANAAHKHEFLMQLAESMPLPDYFGINWDAFDECVHDLSWIAQPRVVLYHERLPIGLPERDLRVYLEILRDAAQTWRAAGADREFAVVFPSSARARVGQLLGA